MGRPPKHGMCGTPTHSSWGAMYKRCRNPKATGFERYGGAGVDICPEWMGEFGFQNFIKDMGERPIGTTLDRIDGTKGYFKLNCRWATRHQQAANRKSNRFSQMLADVVRVNHSAGIFTQRELAKWFGVSKQIINDVVLRRTWSPP